MEITALTDQLGCQLTALIITPAKTLADDFPTDIEHSHFTITVMFDRIVMKLV